MQVFSSSKFAALAAACVLLIAMTSFETADATEIKDEILYGPDGNILEIDSPFAQTGRNLRAAAAANDNIPTKDKL